MGCGLAQFRRACCLQLSVSLRLLQRALPRRAVDLFTCSARALELRIRLDLPWASCCVCVVGACAATCVLLAQLEPPPSPQRVQQRVLKDSRIDKSEVHDVVLVRIDWSLCDAACGTATCVRPNRMWLAFRLLACSLRSCPPCGSTLILNWLASQMQMSGPAQPGLALLPLIAGGRLHPHP